MTKLLTCANVTIAYQGVPCVHDLSLELAAGETLGVVGESGSGKSTLLRALMGFSRTGGAVTSGEISYNGESLTGGPVEKWRQLRGREIAMLFQDAAASLVPVQTIGRQVWECLRAQGAADRKRVRTEAMALFQRLRFSDPEGLWRSYPCELSGGMAQRVCLAMALLTGPKLLLADEPTSALDVIAQSRVVDELCAVKRQTGMAMLVVSHDFGVIAALADRILVLKDGREVEQGKARQVLNDPRAEYTRQLIRVAPVL